MHHHHSHLIAPRHGSGREQRLRRQHYIACMQRTKLCTHTTARQRPQCFLSSARLGHACRFCLDQASPSEYTIHACCISTLGVPSTTSRVRVRVCSTAANATGTPCLRVCHTSITAFDPKKTGPSSQKSSDISQPFLSFCILGRCHVNCGAAKIDRCSLLRLTAIYAARFWSPTLQPSITSYYQALPRERMNTGVFAASIACCGLYIYAYHSFQGQVIFPSNK
jgi:hypothetical protein